MKARPRSVENRVADCLNEQFSREGWRCVERIPVLGRTGPDLSINELGLVVDVKSRLEVPKTIFFPLLAPFFFDHLVGVRLPSFSLLWKEDPYDLPAAPLDFSSKLITAYLEHMEAWTAANAPQGVSCIVLHRPEMPIGSAVAIIHSANRRRLYDNAKQYRHHCLSTE